MIVSAKGGRGDGGEVVNSHGRDLMSKPQKNSRQVGILFTALGECERHRMGTQWRAKVPRRLAAERQTRAAARRWYAVRLATRTMSERAWRPGVACE